MHEFMNRGYHAREGGPDLAGRAGRGLRGGDLRFEIGRVGRGRIGEGRGVPRGDAPDEVRAPLQGSGYGGGIDPGRCPGLR